MSCLNPGPGSKSLFQKITTHSIWKNQCLSTESSWMLSVNILLIESNRQRLKLKKNGMRCLTQPEGRDSGRAKTGLELRLRASFLSVSNTYLHLLSKPSAFPCSTLYQACAFGTAPYFSHRFNTNTIPCSLPPHLIGLQGVIPVNDSSS